MSVNADVIHFIGWGEDWADYNARLQKHREMLPAWKAERAKRRPPISVYVDPEPAADVDPMQEDPREWEFQWLCQRSKYIKLSVSPSQMGGPAGHHYRPGAE